MRRFVRVQQRHRLVRGGLPAGDEDFGQGGAEAVLGTGIALGVARDVGQRATRRLEGSTPATVLTSSSGENGFCSSGASADSVVSSPA